MKNSAIWSIMKKSKHLRLAETQGEQWCTDGLFAYNISSLPPLTPEQFIAIIGVESEKRNDYNCKYDEALALAIYPKRDTYTEETAEICKISISFCGKEYLPLLSPFGVFFIDVKALKPFSDDFADLLFCCRKYIDNAVMIILKLGMLQVGMVCPKKIEDNIHEDLNRLNNAVKKQVEDGQLEEI